MAVRLKADTTDNDCRLTTVDYFASVAALFARSGVIVQ